jgi:hypothetical protein
MSIAIEYQSVLSKIKIMHSDFLKKYSVIIDRNTANQQMYRDLIYSKLTFVGKILQEGGVIESYEEVCFDDSINIDILHTLFARSIILKIKHPFNNSVYLLNGGKDVFVYDGIIDEKINIISLPSIIAGNSNDIVKIKKFQDVLQENFDWSSFAIQIVELIHQTTHKKQNLLDQLLQ